MILVVFESIKTLKVSRPIQVTGVDYTAEAVKSVTPGEMTATINRLLDLIGKRTIERGVNVLN